MNKQTMRFITCTNFNFIKIKTNLLKCISLIYLFKAPTYEANGSVRKMISGSSFTSLKPLA